MYGSADALDEEIHQHWKRQLNLLMKEQKKGANRTKEMVATKGRAKFLGERSKGFMDAGSCSISFIFETIAEIFGGDQ